MTEHSTTPNMNIEFIAPESKKKRKMRESMERNLGKVSYESVSATLMFQEPGQTTPRSSDSEPYPAYVQYAAMPIEQAERVREMNYSHPYEEVHTYPEIAETPNIHPFHSSHNT